MSSCSRVVASCTVQHDLVPPPGDPGEPAKPEGDRRATLPASDDEGAKDVVATLIRDLGFAPVDTGGLDDGATRPQPGTPLYNADVSGAQARRHLADA